MTKENDTSLLLAAESLVKNYDSVEALRGASFQAQASEVTALIGDNGAGKSTLVKCLSGAEQPHSGASCWTASPSHSTHRPRRARSVSRPSTRTSQWLPNSIRPPICSSAGEIRRRWLLGKLGMLDKPEMRRRAVEEFERLGVT